jgi:hypothetical protein
MPEACAEREKFKMSSTEIAVAKREATDVTLTGGGGNRDVYMAVADAVAPRHVQGSLLKFNKGEWLSGEAQQSRSIRRSGQPTWVRALSNASF